MTKSDIISLANLTCSSTSMAFQGYLIGGTALVVAGIQAQTKDFDIIFIDKQNRDAFLRASKTLGFQLSIEAQRVLETHSEAPIEIIKDNTHLDLFVSITTHFYLSSSMIRRASKIADIGEIGRIYSLCPQDILLLKSATGRPVDIGRAQAIIEHTKIHWEEVVNEIICQEKAGMNRAAYDVLELIQSPEIKLTIPNWVFLTLLERVELRIANIRAHLTDQNG